MSNLGNKEVFAENLRRYMAEYGLERNDVARITDKSYTTVTDWYNAVSYPRIDSIEKLANYFRITKSDLIEKQDEIVSQDVAYLMDEIKKADVKKIKRFKKMMDLLNDEESNNT